jgi:hypothetical protein
MNMAPCFSQSASSAAPNADVLRALAGAELQREQREHEATQVREREWRLEAGRCARLVENSDAALRQKDSELTEVTRGLEATRIDLNYANSLLQQQRSEMAYVAQHSSSLAANFDAALRQKDSELTEARRALRASSKDSDNAKRWVEYVRQMNYYKGKIMSRFKIDGTAPLPESASGSEKHLMTALFAHGHGFLGQVSANENYPSENIGVSTGTDCGVQQRFTRIFDLIKVAWNGEAVLKLADSTTKDNRLDEWEMMKKQDLHPSTMNTSTANALHEVEHTPVHYTRTDGIAVSRPGVVPSAQPIVHVRKIVTDIAWEALGVEEGLEGEKNSWRMRPEIAIPKIFQLMKLDRFTGARLPLKLKVSMDGAPTEKKASLVSLTLSFIDARISDVSRHHPQSRELVVPIAGYFGKEALKGMNDVFAGTLDYLYDAQENGGVELEDGERVPIDLIVVPDLSAVWKATGQDDGENKVGGPMGGSVVWPCIWCPVTSASQLKGQVGGCAACSRRHCSQTCIHNDMFNPAVREKLSRERQRTEKECNEQSGGSSDWAKKAPTVTCSSGYFDFFFFNGRFRGRESAQRARLDAKRRKMMLTF